MDRTIEIKNIKGIRKLRFQIPQGGVHVLTGANGSGKTTLLACLHRLSYSNAFQAYFKTSPANNVDEFTGSIHYTHQGQSVTYSYGTSRWSPSPKRGSVILRSFGFRNIKFIGSSGVQRFYVQEGELNTRRIDHASQFVQEKMNYLFDTSKFSQLRKIRVNPSRRRGATSRQNVAYLLPYSIRNRQYYYSEKNFSLGEILMINLLEVIEDIGINSLLLIDEIELALHPRAQVRLYQLLENLALQKQITVLISTHSASIINFAKKIIYLEKQIDGVVEVMSKCYPAYVLKNIGQHTDHHPDVVITVEDEEAEAWLRCALERYYLCTNKTHRPTVRIVPIGGHPQVIEFTRRSRNTLFPNTVKFSCFLDFDVEAHISTLRAKNPRKSGEQEYLEKVDALGGSCRFLPITPEVGMIDFLNQVSISHRTGLSQLFQDFGTVDINRILEDEERTNGGHRSQKPRDIAKQKMWYLVNEICESTNLGGNQVREKLYRFYVDIVYPNNNHGQLLGLFNPIFA